MADFPANHDEAQTPHEHVGAKCDLARHHGEDVVCVDDVSFAYQGKPALERIQLHVQRGSTLGIIGPNGSGKTTLLKLMLGLLAPDSGRVEILGMSPREACARGNLIGYVPQRHELDWTFPVSVRQVVELGLAGEDGLTGRPSRTQRSRATELLGAVGMADVADDPIGELSGGQQQRVFIARALVAGPRIVILDEPMTGIDQGAQESLMGLLEQAKAQMGLTLVMVSHNLRSIIACCDQLACLNRTLHYHDRPAGLSRETLLHVFQCDVDAMLDAHLHE